MGRVARRVGRLFAAALAAAVLSATAASAQSGVIFGGFDASRGGTFSLRDGTNLSNLRGAITSGFPGSTFTAAPTLTESYLSGVQVLIVGAPTSNFTATTALSASEQTALVNFVKAGGGLIVVTDNDSYVGGAGAVNNSFLSPFGLSSTGTFGNTLEVTVTNTTHPVTAGPFGPVPSYQTLFPGYFDTLGPNAIPLATLPTNGQHTLAVINREVLGAGSNGVVFFSDMNAFGNELLTTSSNQPLALNAIRYLAPVPEPTAPLLIGTAAAGVVGWRRRRRAVSRSRLRVSF
jgi:hypothetical protein